MRLRPLIAPTLDALVQGQPEKYADVVKEIVPGMMVARSPRLAEVARKAPPVRRRKGRHLSAARLAKERAKAAKAAVTRWGSHIGEPEFPLAAVRAKLLEHTKALMAERPGVLAIDGSELVHPHASEESRKRPMEGLTRVADASKPKKEDGSPQTEPGHLLLLAIYQRDDGIAVPAFCGLHSREAIDPEAGKVLDDFAFYTHYMRPVLAAMSKNNWCALDRGFDARKYYAFHREMGVRTLTAVNHRGGAAQRRVMVDGVIMSVKRAQKLITCDHVVTRTLRAEKRLVDVQERVGLLKVYAVDEDGVAEDAPSTLMVIQGKRWSRKHKAVTSFTGYRMANCWEGNSQEKAAELVDVYRRRWGVEGTIRQAKDRTGFGFGLETILTRRFAAAKAVVLMFQVAATLLAQLELSTDAEVVEALANGRSRYARDTRYQDVATLAGVIAAEFEQMWAALTRLAPWPMRRRSPSKLTEEERGRLERKLRALRQQEQEVLRRLAA